jgi:hypothetical protein
MRLGKRATPRDSYRFWLALLGSASTRLRAERTGCCPYRQPDLSSQRHDDVAGGGETPVVAYIFFGLALAMLLPIFLVLRKLEPRHAGPEQTPKSYT